MKLEIPSPKSSIPSPQSKLGLFATLPAPWPDDLLPCIREGVAKSGRKVVVLDDDPTGTQTVYGVPVLTTWQPEELAREFANDVACFYILTNSRSLPADEAYELNEEIARNLKQAAVEANAEFSVVSRSDSTLRGHFPGEPQALTEVLGGFDAVILIPYFEAGGRYTIGDVHYVAEDDVLVPAAETPFARDAAFGYRSSNLREWVAEKCGGAVTAKSVASISIEDIRSGGPKVVCERLLQISFGNICVVNAACPRDLEVFVQGLVAAEAEGRRFLFRTAASFVAARLGLAARELWKPGQTSERGCVADQPQHLESIGALRLVEDGTAALRPKGGLIIVGSYVPKTTAQLESLLAKSEVERVEISVEAVLDVAKRAGELSRAVMQTNSALLASRDVVLFTSRKLVTGAGAEASLAIGNQISDALVELLQRIEVAPRYLIAKGGITSSDLATRGLGVKRAMVLGQILPGVPVWELGAETKFPGLPYVVFPGNVGGPDALAQAVALLNPKS